MVTSDLLNSPLRAELQRYSSARGTVSLAATDEAWLAIPPYARARFQIVNGTLYKAPARCVYRRDETIAWALLQMLERHPDQPDVDVVFNCRDGPLLRRRWASKSGQRPMVFTFSTDDEHAELAFPDYTLWGLPGKLKPWAQLRLDLLHRAQLPWAERDPRLFASGVVNSYHSSIGYDVLTRLLVPGVHYVSVPLPPPERNICTALDEAVSWADAHPHKAQAIARAGRALVRDEMSMRQIYAYMSEALRGAGALLRYDAALGVNASNASRVPAEAEAFVAAMRNDTSYPVTSQIRANDWADVVLRYNYSSMGAGFRASAAYLRQVVAEIHAKQREEEQARRAKVAERKRQRGRGGAGRRRGRGGGGRGGRGRLRRI